MPYLYFANKSPGENTGQSIDDNSSLNLHCSGEVIY